MMTVCILCRAVRPDELLGAESPAAAGGVCSGCEVELRAWLQWRARLTPLSPPHTAHRTLRVVLTRLDPRSLPPPCAQQLPARPLEPAAHTGGARNSGGPLGSAPPRPLHSSLADLPDPLTPCPLCKVMFNSRAYIRRHLTLVHRITDAARIKSIMDSVVSGTINCKLCDRKFVNRSTLSRHIIACHTDYQDRPFPCNFCPKKFSRTAHLLHHQKTHYERKFSCDLCNFKAHHKYGILVHIENKHLAANTIPTFLCSFSFCNKKYKTSDYLRKHVNRVHHGKKFNCAECDRKFKTKNLLQRHLRDVHFNKKVKCDLCDAILKNERNLLGHKQNVHVKSNDGCKCDICGKWCKSKIRLASHKCQWHREIPLCKCDLCGRMFKGKNRLAVHFRHVHLVDPQSCKECGAKFKNEQRLIYHMHNVHASKDKRTKCTDCVVWFKTRHDMVNHRKVAHVIDPVKCRRCGVEYRNKILARSHERIVCFKKNK